jgi:hypothetical protein
VPAVSFGYCAHHVKTYVHADTAQVVLPKSCKWLTNKKLCGAATSGRFCKQHILEDIAKKSATRATSCGWLTDGNQCGANASGRFCDQHTQDAAKKKTAAKPVVEQIVRQCRWLTDGSVCGVETTKRFCDTHMQADIDKKNQKQITVSINGQHILGPITTSTNRSGKELPSLEEWSYAS